MSKKQNKYDQTFEYCKGVLCKELPEKDKNKAKRKEICSRCYNYELGITYHGVSYEAEDIIPRVHPNF